MGGDESASGGEHIVDQQHPGAVRDVVVRLDGGGAVLERIRDGCRGPGQLARLADRHETRARLHRGGAGEQESARLDPRDDVERSQQRGDVAEQHSRFRIVGDRPDERFGADDGF
jgi:hypothetical protein